MLEQASIIREKRKTIKVSINKDGSITCFCPYGVSYEKIEDILKTKETLLTKKINQTKKLMNKFSKITSLETILLFGKEYLIVPTTKVKKPYFTEEYFLVPKKYNEDKDKLKRLIKKSLSEIAERVITKRLNDILNNYKKYDVSKVVFGSFRSKWGSCDNFGVIKLNWKLVMVEPKLVDFVLFHELTHLIELNHSKKFYIEFGKVFPDYKICKQQLKEYAFLLTIY